MSDQEIHERRARLDRADPELRSAAKALRAALKTTAETRRRLVWILQRKAEAHADRERRTAEANEMTRRIEKNLAEITEKLNRLLASRGVRKPQPPPPAA